MKTIVFLILDDVEHLDNSKSHGVSIYDVTDLNSTCVNEDEFVDELVSSGERRLIRVYGPSEIAAQHNAESHAQKKGWEIWQS